MTRRRWRILLEGVVQGVGFRPHAQRQARALGLAGWTANRGGALELEAEGEEHALAALLVALRDRAPAQARVERATVEEIAPLGDEGFAIQASGPGPIGVLPPDLAPCADCLRELFDPSSRRHRYAFIACTACGPRASIIEALPYDRTRTAMRHFPLCAACAAEYADAADRRCHAEATGCPQCGPRLALCAADGAALPGDPLAGAAALLARGGILALKGQGGWQLLADARDTAAIARLRQGKQRGDKPFAVLFQDISAIAARAPLSPPERDLLTGQGAPILLLRAETADLAPAVAPRSPWLGAMLPASPLHHLLARALDRPLVCTSGNRGGEPILTDDQAARDGLAGLADAFLGHDRPILRPLDDSVLRVAAGAPLPLRLARGFAPGALAVPGVAGGLLGLGAEEKATVALSLPGRVIIGQHVGDLGNAATRDAHARAATDLARLHGIAPRRVACDLHPDYGSTHAALGTGLPVARVPHHLAHVLACLAEHGAAPPVLGVAWDGTGLGEDGSLCGAEFLLVDRGGWRRLARLRPVPLPGAEAAIREPRRAALGLLHAAFGADALARDDLPPLAAFTPAERGVLGRMLARGVQCPMASSAGRLFDAFASLAGLAQRCSHEGEAAMLLEAAAGPPGDTALPFPLRDGEIDWQPALEAWLASAEPLAARAAAFHDGLAAAIAAVARQAGLRDVALSGGCFQNARLLESSVAALHAQGHHVFWPRRVPPNDAAIALGQVLYAAAQEQGSEACAWQYPAAC